MVHQDRRKYAGFALIVVGLGLFGLQFLEGLGDAVVMFVIGSAFLVGYFARRAYGLLIPACVLIGIGIGEVLEMTDFPIYNETTFGLGVGFISIFVIDRFFRGQSSWWPLIPGGILLFNSLAASYDEIQWLVHRGWPLLLALLGVLVMLGVVGRSKRGERTADDRPSEPPPG